MTWTRTKTLVVASLVLLLALAAVYFALQHVPGQKPPAAGITGHWEGALQVGAVQLRLVFHITKTPDGQLEATMDSIDQGARGVPVQSVSYADATLRLGLPALAASYEGRLSRDGTEFSGDFQQAGRLLPLVLRRTEHPTSMEVAWPETAFARREGSDLQGYWNGTLDVGQGRLRVLFKISEPTPGQWAGALDSVDQGVRNIPITSIIYDKPRVAIEVMGVGGRFDGDLNPEGTEIAGTWEQGGRAFPLALQRGSPPETERTSDEASYTFTKETDLQGYWHGTLTVGGRNLRLALQIGKLADGSFRGTMDRLDQGARGIPMTAISNRNSDVQLEWKGLRAVFRGKLENGLLTGIWEQGPVAVPMVFERTNRVAQAAPSPPAK